LLNTWSGTAFDTQLLSMAAALGSDVPFFLEAPAAIVSGRGTDLTPVPAPRGWLLLVTPKVHIHAKTATLYGALTAEDFSTGERVAFQVEYLRSTGTIDPSLLGNAFLRPLQGMVPEIGTTIERMHEAGCRTIALSGAGPTLYSLFDDRAERDAIQTTLVKLLPPSTSVISSAFETETPGSPV
jgi:4-diphosphocytidyl-2-C-methyl-D-erythritol kinase